MPSKSSLAVNVAVQVMSSLLVSVPSVPPTSVTSALPKPVTASEKVIVTSELLSPSLSAASVMTTVAVGLLVSTATVAEELTLPVLPAASVKAPTVKVIVPAAVSAGGVRVAV